MTRHGPAGDDSARRFRNVTLPYLDDAYALAYFFMRNRADAEDAVQECYLRAFRHFDRWTGPAVRPWLFAILRNVCLSDLSRRGRQRKLQESMESQPLAESLLGGQGLPCPDETVLRREAEAAVRQLLDALPMQFREAIVLREFEDLSYREIAEATGVPIGTVMSRLARGRALLVAGWKAQSRADDEPAVPSQIAYSLSRNGAVISVHRRR